MSDILCDSKNDKESKYSSNIKLVLEAQAGNLDASEELIKNNMGLVRSIASRFCGRGTELEDLLQIGTIGMLKAIRSYDVSRGCAFSTYAVPLILGEIRRFLRDDGLLKVCRPQKTLGAALMRERENFISRNGREPGIAELAKLCEVSPEEAAVALVAVSPVSSLSEPVFGEEDGVTLAGILHAEDQNELSVDRLSISEALAKLPPVWKKIIMLRYFRDYSQQQTAEALGLTQVKISREEKKIVDFLRKELG
ncbi:MAG: sigma-70 family RNA polymerase sigma factor [Clostridiales bacterium]|nr:sigma-70 family RNA polymerase sigma factor [Clostridiales bacterium]